MARQVGVMDVPPYGGGGTDAWPFWDMRGYATLADAIAAIGATEATLGIASQLDVLADITIPANVTLFFTEGGSLAIDNLITVTINGHVQAGLYQIFNWAGTGKVTFGPGAIKEAYPEWWGAKGDAVTNDAVAIQRVFDNASVYNIFFSAREYKVTAAISLIRAYVHLQGSSFGTQIKGYGAIGNTFKLGDGTGVSQYGSIRNLKFVTNDATTLFAFLIDMAHHYEFYSVHAWGGGTAALEIKDSYDQHWFGGTANYSAGKGIYLKNVATGSNEIKFFGMSVFGNAGLGIDDEGGAGRHYDIYAELNLGGAMRLVGVLGFTARGGYFEANTGYDIILSGCYGGFIDGQYLTSGEANHKYIYLINCRGITVGGFVVGATALAGHYGVYVDAGNSGIAILPFDFILSGGAAGVAVGGPGGWETQVVMYVQANQTTLQGKVSLRALASYVNNAAAVAAGLISGDLYCETGTNPLRVAKVI